MKAAPPTITVTAASRTQSSAAVPLPRCLDERRLDLLLLFLASPRCFFAFAFCFFSACKAISSSSSDAAERIGEETMPFLFALVLDKQSFLASRSTHRMRRRSSLVLLCAVGVHGRCGTGCQRYLRTISPPSRQMVHERNTIAAWAAKQGANVVPAPEHSRPASTLRPRRRRLRASSGS